MATSLRVMTVFGTKLSVVDGNTFASLYAGYECDAEDNAEGMKGFQVVKMSCEPEVCEAIPADAQFPIEVELEVKQKVKNNNLVDRAVRLSMIPADKPAAPKAAKKD